MDQVGNTLISLIVATKTEDAKRRTLIDAIKNAIEKRFEGVRVFTYGSFPLKIYSPEDGDIDFTLLGGNNSRILDDLRSFFDQNCLGDFKIQVIKHVKPENAFGVEVLKCETQDHVLLDFTQNQYKALISLWMIDMINFQIGWDNLVKKSIILIKWWAKHRARIIDTQEKLLSSYAIEVMTIHVIQKFHPSLRTPLDVVKTFVEYYSNFKWHPENTISILHHEFRYIFDKCAFGMGQSKYSNFYVKGLDVVDPVDPLNNIGSKRVYEIVSAMKQAQGIATTEGVQGLFSEFLNRQKVVASSSSSSSLCLDTNYKIIYDEIVEAQRFYHRGHGVVMQNQQPPHHGGYDGGLGDGSPFVRAGGYFHGPRYLSQFERGGRSFNGQGYYRQQPHVITQPRPQHPRPQPQPRFRLEAPSFFTSATQPEAQEPLAEQPEAREPGPKF